MPNQLNQTQSLYLRKHANNPIDWYPWSDEALTKARQENKPIFLSIGYSSCHWCTVMEGEAFSDQAIADYMNIHYVAIKVDREERPDIDSIYMQTLQMMTGQGGWPLNVFLDPTDLLPFYGGTYFPLEPKYGRPGFLQVLQALHNFYQVETTKLGAVKTELANRLQQTTAIASALSGAAELSHTLLEQGLASSLSILSNQDMAPCFPMIPYGETGLRATRFDLPKAQQDARAITQRRGLNLVLGGIFDQVGGGFHRYTVDATWTVPHFEKMLYDNGLIVEYLANLWANGLTEPAVDRAIALTFAWLKREMLAPEGYFYAAQDADSFLSPQDTEPEEGAFYIWAYRELEQSLSPAELTELSEQFTVSLNGNFEGKTNVLQRKNAGALSDSVEATLTKLFTRRYGEAPDKLSLFPPACNNEAAKTLPWAGRIPSVTDPKMIVAWNSLMISGLARAAAVFQNEDYLALATQVAEFILMHQWAKPWGDDSGIDRFHRLNYGFNSEFNPEGQPQVIAQSEDYALFIKALLDLHQASIGCSIGSGGSPVQVGADSGIAHSSGADTRDPWLAKAVLVQAEFDDYLWSVELGGYYNTDARSDLLVRERSFADNAVPAANGIAFANLVRLALLTEDLTYLDRAEQGLQAFSQIMAEAPSACPSLFTALDWFRNATLIRTTPEQIVQLRRRYLPTVVFQPTTTLPQGVIALVCQGLKCLEAARSIEQMEAQIQRSLVR